MIDSKQEIVALSHLKTGERQPVLIHGFNGRPVSVRQDGDRTGLIEMVKAAGVVGASGVGFPTCMGLSVRTKCFVVNDAECEPLIETDRYLMHTFPDQVIRAVGAVAAHVGVKGAVIAPKKKYVKETAVLRQTVATSNAQIELFETPSFYLAGDEQVLIQRVCDTSVPEHGIPLDVGAVVDSMGALLNTHDALQGTLVTEEYLSVVDGVERPVMRRVPFGMPLQEYIDSARPYLQDCIVIVGSPMMGRAVTDSVKADRLTVTRTAGNLIVLLNEHYSARRATLPLSQIKTQVKSVCVQCRMCTSLCPRYSIGYQIQSHLMMRSLFREELIPDSDEYEKAFGQAASCCGCGAYKMFSCPMGLSPRKVNTYLKDRLREKGIQVPQNLSPKARGGSLYGKAPTDHLVARLGLPEYRHQHTGNDYTELFPERMQISFRQYIGRPAVPAVQAGEMVQKGGLLASAAQGLSANIRASVDRTITEVSEDGTSIRRDREA